MDMDYNPFSSDPPEQTAEEADIENKAALITEFTQAANRLLELLDEMGSEGLLPETTQVERLFWKDVRDKVGVALYQFEPEPDERSLEDLS